MEDQKIKLIEQAFAKLEMPEGLEVVDKLRNIEQEETLDDGDERYIATCFALYDNDKGDSFKVSVHFELNSKGQVQHCYAYDCRNGTEIASTSF